ncbi:Uncharacterised protein [uncultured archaeon]|nr:Uncharacterised protein [uncultured archaeon]
MNFEDFPDNIPCVEMVRGNYKKRIVDVLFCAQNRIPHAFCFRLGYEFQGHACRRIYSFLEVRRQVLDNNNVSYPCRCNALDCAQKKGFSHNFDKRFVISFIQGPESRGFACCKNYCVHNNQLYVSYYICFMIRISY